MTMLTEDEKLRGEVRALESQEMGAAECCYAHERAIERVRALAESWLTEPCVAARVEKLAAELESWGGSMASTLAKAIRATLRGEVPHV